MCRFTDVISAFSGIAAPLSAIAALLSVVMAWLTVRETRAGRREEKRSVRPYFHVGRVMAWDQTDGKHGIRATLSNSGEHPAANLKVFVSLMDVGPGRGRPFSWEIERSEIRRGEDILWHENGLQMASELPAHYITFKLHYDDPFTHEPFDQILALRWEGVADGKVSERFSLVTVEEVEKIRRACE
jgi:hypothetical protein